MPGHLRVLITGASSGIGREMARQLAARHVRLALTGRRGALVEEAAAEARKAGASDVLALVGSVADRAAVREHYALVKERWGGLDWAILNAGAADREPHADFSAEEYHSAFATNVGGAVNWVEAVLPDMKAARRGTIAGMASLAACRGIPGYGPYSASKAALVAFLETLRVDHIGTGIRVVTVQPGFIGTGMTDTRLENTWFTVPAPSAIRRILRGIENGSPVVAFPWPLAFFMRYMLRNAPCWLYDRVIRSLV